MGLILLTAWGSFPYVGGVSWTLDLEAFAALLGFAAGLDPALAFGAAFTPLDFTGLVALRAILTTGLLAFFAGLGAGFGPCFGMSFGLVFSFVLLAIVHSTQIQRLGNI
jgi:hypothetical protein